MAVRIPSEQIQNPQQIEVTVAGPDGANRLFTIAGQIPNLFARAAGSASLVDNSQTFSVLIGPRFTRQQFFKAIGSAWVTKEVISIATQPPGFFSSEIVNVDSDWDDESGQVELRIEVLTRAMGQNNYVAVEKLAFHASILATVET